MRGFFIFVMFEVYILYSEKSQLYYVGQTSDLAQRL
ncbi:MAG: GIY-YIG nuclease family protein, partial [Bacteroidia bacterium]|nr:GIY-YIG nuclease family protein [Bacteroidia bacterium]